MRLVPCVAALLLCAVASAKQSFEIVNGTFMKDGKPFRIMSGSIHYSRVPPELWADRLQRLRAMGLNAIETYVFWNFHQNEFDAQTGKPLPARFDGEADLAAFCQAAQDAGLVVLLRLGPYGCGEWNGGGFPWWLHQLDANLQVRTYAEPYISAVEQWWAQLLPYVKRNGLLYADGGSVIMAQVENEFGSFGNVAGNPLDKQYLEHLVDLAREALGNDVVLYTTDGGSTGYMSRGSLNTTAVYTVGDFGPGSNPEGSFAAQDAFNPPPLRGAHLCSEFYSGWLTHWGEHMANTSSSGLAAAMDRLFALNGSLSLYMGHGGTNFGTWAGANGGGQSFQPHITSYDYDAPLSESGQHGFGSDGQDKFADTQAVLLNWTRNDGAPLPPPEAPALPLAGYGAVAMSDATPLLAKATLAALVAPNGTATTPAGEPPLALHTFGVSDGLLWLRSPRPGPADAAGAAVDVGDPHDRAHVFVDAQLAGVAWRPEPAPVAVRAPSPAGSTPEVAVLVESMSRINYGREMFDKKGVGPRAVPGGANVTITFPALASSPQTLQGPWKHVAVPLNDATAARVPFGAAGAPLVNGSQAAFFRGTFTASAPANGQQQNEEGATTASNTPAGTYIGMYGWSKGYVWLNGRLLGRYWQSKGPQRTLYAPSPWLRAGSNEVVVLELDTPAANASVVSVPYADFHYGTPCNAAATPAAGDRVVMASASTSAVGSSNQAWTAPSTSQPGPIKLAADSSLCVQAGPLTDPSTGRPAIQLAACASTSDVAAASSQMWELQANGELVVSSDKSCMDITAHDTGENAPVETYACNGGSNQQWIVKPAQTGAAVTIGTQMDSEVLTVCAV